MTKLKLSLILVLLGVALCSAAEPKVDTSRGDQMLAEYFRQETARLSSACLAETKSGEDWQRNREEYRRQLLEMLGLDPLPEKTDLKPTVTGTVQEDEFHVERIHFQSRPGLYVTGNLYIPNKVDGKLPAILYVCGHGAVKKDGISYGNKVHYQHHGAWFARNGYVCLSIDTLQMGEIEGIHHGTHRYGMWWWLNRGYTSAGVEAWNCVRALDYLQTRPEVDPERIGVTGRSGGGAYSWWIAAIDDRIKCAVPVAGITDLKNHVVDGCVEGHCDCMYMVNTYRWDYAQVAALVAPRPLLISNTDTDAIFPLDGVVRLFEQVRRVYALNGAKDKVALNITAGGHKDTQELQVHAFRWFNEHLKGDKSLIEKTAVPYFEPPELRVFQDLPADELNTKIQETFVAKKQLEAVPGDANAWQMQRDQWLDALRQKSFRGWPTEPGSLSVTEVMKSHRDGLAFRAFDFTSQGPVRLRMYVLNQAGLDHPEAAVLKVLDEQAWRELLASLAPVFSQELKDESLPAPMDDAFQSLKKSLTDEKKVFVYVVPRGIGPTAFDTTEKKQVQNRRRFYLLGQTLDGMQVWDIRRSIQALRSLPEFEKQSIELQSQRQMAGNTLYAALFEPGIKQLDLYDLPVSHREGPYYLNVERLLDLPVTVGMVAEKTQVNLHHPDKDAWKWPAQLAETLGWKTLAVRSQ